MKITVKRRNDLIKLLINYKDSMGNHLSKGGVISEKEYLNATKQIKYLKNSDN